ncbi:MAG TPA: LuxR C-terminal-related transcriptional regulator [Solirubrobacterales bacterium]
MVIGIAMNRDRRSFSERDRLLLELLRPHLTRAYGAASGAALDLLHAYFPEAGGSSLPAEIVDWRANASALGAASLSVVSDRGQLMVRETPTGAAGPLLVPEEERAVGIEALRALGLTSRQAEVLHLLAQGRSTAQIAADLFISPQTVRKHLKHIYERLGVHTRGAAVAMVREASKAPRAQELSP